MNIGDHRPPHFHAEYAEHEASISIRDGETIVGALPGRALRLVREWWELHRQELADNWQRMEREETLQRIAPL